MVGRGVGGRAILTLGTESDLFISCFVVTAADVGFGKIFSETFGFSLTKENRLWVESKNINIIWQLNILQISHFRIGVGGQETGLILLGLYSYFISSFCLSLLARVLMYLRSGE